MRDIFQSIPGDGTHGVCYLAENQRGSGRDQVARDRRTRRAEGDMATIRNPIEFTADQLGAASDHLAHIGRAVRGAEHDTEPQVRRIGAEDLKESLRRGLDDFMACRTDVVFICIVYPLAGILLAWFFFDYRMLPLIFPAASGFALVGPFAAIGMYEMSRRRERGEPSGWMQALGVLGSPSFGAIFLLGMALFFVFALWMVTAWGIWSATLAAADG
jgi:uncharacterized membrane protein